MFLSLVLYLMSTTYLIWVILSVVSWVLMCLPDIVVWEDITHSTSVVLTSMEQQQKLKLCKKNALQKRYVQNISRFTRNVTTGLTSILITLVEHRHRSTPKSRKISSWTSTLSTQPNTQNHKPIVSLATSF